nr:immunoglobulin heavy chain junction region [Mus musculus]MBK4183705.1 immunoglobulin heavy chain junction region [Mus musculus]
CARKSGIYYGPMDYW